VVVPRKDVDSELAFEFSKHRVLLQLCVSLSAKAMPPFSCIALPCVSGSWQGRLFNAPYLFGFKHGKHT
jgi:hypothetical protein